MQDSIEKSLELRAPVARVWRALTDYTEFGEWFRVKLEGPFVVGEISLGRITHPGCEHMKWEAKVLVMEHERLFSFEWCPYEFGPEIDYSEQPKTLVEFRLEPAPGGTRLEIKESGFDALPDDTRRIDAFRSNTRGWNEQAKNIAAHVEN